VTAAGSAAALRPAWWRTAGIVAAALLALIGVGAVTAAGVYRSRAPATVLRFMPLDARAKATLARNAALAGRPDAAALARAREALRRELLAGDAVVALGIGAAVDGRMAAAEAVFTQAERWSRRNVAAQLWLIERAVQRDDLDGALVHYDRAMRVSPAVRATLFPILIAGAGDPRIAVRLNRMLRAGPTWRTDFLNHFLTESDDPVALAQLSAGLLDRRRPADRQSADTLLRRLVALNRPDLAWAHYRSIAGPAAEGAIRDPSFTGGDPVGPFEWRYAEAGELLPEAAPRPDRGPGNALFLPVSGSGGEVARQMLHLAPGRYRLSYRTGELGAADGARPLLRLLCVAGGAVPLAAELPRTGAAATDGAVAFTVPAGCAFQWLVLDVPAGAAPDGGGGATPWIAAPAIRPAG
jgi:tetratricopeptide (TPR) repeat protein